MITIKSEKELKLMREPCKIVRDTLLLVESKIRAGMTTKELDAIIHDYIVSRGARPTFLGLYGFPASACISIDEEVVHGIPSDRVIEEGQITEHGTHAELVALGGSYARMNAIQSDEDKGKE